MYPRLFSFTNTVIHRTEVEVDKASTGEFGCPPLAGVQTAHGVTEGLLMVVKPQPGRVELPANIHHDAAGLQHCRVPGPHYLSLSVPRQQLQQRAGQGLVTVEGAIMSPDGDLEHRLKLSGSVRVRSGLPCMLRYWGSSSSVSSLTGLQDSELSVRLVSSPSWLSGVAAV